MVLLRVGDPERKRTLTDAEFLAGLRLFEQEVCRRSFQVAKELVADPGITTAKFWFVEAVARMSQYLKSRDDERRTTGRAIADEILKGGDLPDPPARGDTPPKP